MSGSECLRGKGGSRPALRRRLYASESMAGTAVAGGPATLFRSQSMPKLNFAELQDLSIASKKGSFGFVREPELPIFMRKKISSWGGKVGVFHQKSLKF